MYKHLLTVLAILITLVATAQPVSAATAPTAPKAPTTEKKYYGVWQRMTLKNLLQKQSSTPTTASPTKTPTPAQRRAANPAVNTPTPTTKAANPTPTKAQTPVAAPAATNDVTAFIMKEINDYRASQGLGSVQTSSETCSFAKTRAQEISTNFSHDGFSQRRDNKTLPYASWTAITENIAMTGNYKDVVTMWKNSSGHAANMRANTPYVCVMQHGNYYAYEGMKP